MNPPPHGGRREENLPAALQGADCRDIFLRKSVKLAFRLPVFSKNKTNQRNGAVNRLILARSATTVADKSTLGGGKCTLGGEIRTPKGETFSLRGCVLKPGGWKAEGFRVPPPPLQGGSDTPQGARTNLGRWPGHGREVRPRSERGGCPSSEGGAESGRPVENGRIDLSARRKSPGSGFGGGRSSVAGGVARSHGDRGGSRKRPATIPPPACFNTLEFQPRMNTDKTRTFGLRPGEAVFICR